MYATVDALYTTIRQQIVLYTNANAVARAVHTATVAVHFYFGTNQKKL